jgi:tight adherence protein B
MAGWLIASGVFVLVVAAVLGLYGAILRLPEARMRRRLDKRISDEMGGLVAAQTGEKVDGLIKTQSSGALPGLDRMVAGTARGSALGRWIAQSGMRVSISSVLAFTVLLAALLATIALMFTNIWWILLGAGLVGGLIPFGVVRSRRKSRLKKFEEYFPEALDLMARAVRAGHAFNTGVKMVADEMGEPVGPEFRKIFDEQNFGLSVADALDNLSERIPILDVRFFVTAVLIQRETGGNLSEILENLAFVVRERFKILRQVRVYTAHGRFTGYVLLGLPAVLAIALMFINPDHMNLLFKEPLGQTLLMVAIGLQVAGYFWISRIVKIEV